MKTGTEINGVTFYRVDNDVNGNPRYVVHFRDIAEEYNEAHKRAKSLGGRKYTASWFGGGFVFQSYNINGLAEKINAMK